MIYSRINPNSTLPYGGGEYESKAGLDPFQIVLIVVCVALAIGLIVALIVLLYYGRWENFRSIQMKRAKFKSPFLFEFFFILFHSLIAQTELLRNSRKQVRQEAEQEDEAFVRRPAWLPEGGSTSKQAQ